MTQEIKFLTREEAGYAPIPHMMDGSRAPVCLVAGCGELAFGQWRDACWEHKDLMLCPRCRLLDAEKPGALCGNCRYNNMTSGSKGSLGQPYFEER